MMAQWICPTLARIKPRQTNPMPFGQTMILTEAIRWILERILNRTIWSQLIVMIAITQWVETESFPAPATWKIFQEYGLADDHISAIIDKLREDPHKWVDFMMRFELGLEAPNPSRAFYSALTIAISYIIGGLVPLMPYIFIDDSGIALKISAIVTSIALFGFGYIKGSFTGAKPIVSAIQTLLIGGLAATAAFSIARVFH